MRIGSLFAGIGGLELGLERAGIGRTAWQVEIDLDCRSVLAQHWPESERFADVREFEGRPAELICGGFPCQNLSHANVKTRTGLDGPKSGLWSEYVRIVSGVRPRWVVVENIADGWREWVPTVRGDLRRLGYASLSFLLCPSWIGAPHARPRVFVVANADREGESLRTVDAEVARLRSVPAAVWDRWEPEPDRVRADDGVPGRMGECRRYGNAVVPQVAEVIGRAIAVADAEVRLPT